MNRSFLCAVCAATLATNCATVGQVAFAEPTVTLREVRVAGLGLSGGTLNLILDVDNPNPFRLSGVGLTARLNLDATPFGSAQWDRDLSVPANGIGTVEVPLRFTWSGVGAGARSLLRSGSIPYHIEGELTTNTPLGPFATTFKNEGSVTMLDLVRREP